MGSLENQVSAARLIADSCIASRVRVINRVITSLYDEALRPHGLRITQANLLVALVGLGRARPVEVCRSLRIEKSTLSRDVELLKRNGWVDSDPPAGGRHQVLRVTSEGLALLERVHPAWEAAQDEASRLLGDSGTSAIRAIAGQLGLGRLSG